MQTRKSTIYLILIALIGTVLAFMHLFQARYSVPRHKTTLRENKRLVRELGITDLCLFTEARYTRHPSQADLHSPFQDHPMALEHFPSGSILSPPPIVDN